MAGSAFKNADAIQSLSVYTPVLIDGDVEKDMTKRYSVSGYPAVVIVDAAGDEIDRIVGYRETDKYIAEVERIKRGENTIPALAKKYADSPDDVDAGIAYGARLAVSKPDAAAKLFGDLAEKSREKDRATQAKVKLEYASALLAARNSEGAAYEAEKLVKEFDDTPAAAQAARRVGRAFVGVDASRALAFLEAVRGLAKEPADQEAVETITISVLKNAMAASLKRRGAAAGDDPAKLNAVAWDCFEQKLNLRDAVALARKGVEKSKDDASLQPMIMDTLANLLWITGARDEAIKVETDAAAKCTDEHKPEFEVLVAKWTAELEAMKAKKAAK